MKVFIDMIFLNVLNDLLYTESKVGERIFLEGYDKIPQEMEKQLNKTVLEKCFPLMKTNADKFATFNGRFNNRAE